MLGWGSGETDRSRGKTSGGPHSADTALGGRTGSPKLLRSVLILPVLTIAAGVLIAIALWIVGHRIPEPAPPSTDAPGAFSFGALGDGPYYLWEQGRYQAVLRDLAAHDLRFPGIEAAPEGAKGYLFH